MINRIAEDEMHETAMKLLMARAEEYHQMTRYEDKRWISGELHGLCQAFCMAGVISAADCKTIELLKGGFDA